MRNRRGETRTPRFLERVDPNVRVPVLDLDAGVYLPESDASLPYLADGTPYPPEGRFGRAEVLWWMFFEQYKYNSQNTHA